jgi:ATP-dependent DNA helicase RecG
MDDTLSTGHSRAQTPRFLPYRSHRSWDSESIPDASFKPDAAKVRAYVRKAGLPWTNAQSALKSLGLNVDGHYLNATSVFFAKPPTHALRCAVFATSTTATIIDQHDFNGDILTLIEEAEKYILKNIRIGMKLDGLARVDVPEIDREAFREAIINAFCHRDYRDPDEVRIAIFPDRVEVRNPGRLMEGVTLRTLKTAKVSRRRNPLIADLLRRIHLIEAWGRGIPLIIEKAPQARFSEIAGVFITEFPRPQAAGDSVTKSQPRSDAAGPVTAPVGHQSRHQSRHQSAIMWGNYFTFSANGSRLGMKTSAQRLNLRADDDCGKPTLAQHSRQA